MLITCVKSNDTTNTVEDLKFTGILQTDLNCYIAPPGFLVPKYFSNNDLTKLEEYDFQSAEKLQLLYAQNMCQKRQSKSVEIICDSLIKGACADPLLQIYLDLLALALCNALTGISKPTLLRIVKDLSYNPIIDIKAGTFKDLISLKKLHIQHCRLQSLKPNTFQGLDNLHSLKLDGNMLDYIPSYIFKHLNALQVLSLTKNRIHAFTPESFNGLVQVKRLFLSWNNLVILKDSSFVFLENLQTINIDRNEIRIIEDNAFSNLTHLTSLNLKDNPLQQLNERTFAELRNLEYIYFPEFQFCRFAIQVRVCRPKGDGISSIDHLLDNIVLRISVWLVAFISCVGNLFVLVSRFILKEQNVVHGFYIKNLSVADLLMGVYLFIIASYDVKFRGEYIKEEQSWRSSWQCNFCGFLSTVSSQVSVFILTTITADRVPINADLYAWIAIFVLPVNSALNPILYTITTKLFRHRLNQMIISLFKPRSSCPAASHEPTSVSFSSIFTQSHRKKIRNLNNEGFGKKSGEMVDLFLIVEESKQVYKISTVH
ncbi:Relaxin receptor 1 [Nymphon striatum]|nr:Relaxin receptor 1 [Nymphon striatum]